MPSPISTPAAPAAIGPYSQAIQSGNLLFCSGQIALDPATQEFRAGTAAEETKIVLSNLQAVLAAGGSAPEKVLKTTIYLVDMADFAAVNEVYGEVFDAHKPARACIAVAGLPKGARVEIEAIAETGI